MMSEKTEDLFELLRATIERWSKASGHREAYVRGSQARRDLAEMIFGYRRMLGRRGFLDKLRESFADES